SAELWALNTGSFAALFAVAVPSPLRGAPATTSVKMTPDLASTTGRWVALAPGVKIQMPYSGGAGSALAGATAQGTRCCCASSAKHCAQLTIKRLLPSHIG